jgi:hypothetical protein
MPGQAPILFGGLHNVILNGGTANNTFEVLGAGDTTPITIHGGPGNDLFDVKVGRPSVAAPLSIDGGPGNDGLEVTDTEGTGVVRKIPNAGDPTSGTVTVVYSGGAPTATVNYKDIEAVDALSDVTRRVDIKAVPILFGSHPTAPEFSVTVTNTSAQDINGNIRIVVQGMPPEAALAKVGFGSKSLPVQKDAAGDTFFSVPVAKLGVGQSLQVGLLFANPTSAKFRFVLHVFAESPGP